MFYAIFNMFIIFKIFYILDIYADASTVVNVEKWKRKKCKA